MDKHDRFQERRERRAGAEREVILQPHPRQPRGTSIGAREYCHMLLSRSKLVRKDDVWSGARGLYDPATGESYWVDERELASQLEHTSG